MTGLATRAWRGGAGEHRSAGGRSRLGGSGRGAGSGGGDAGEHLAEHLKHVQLPGVFGLSATVFCLQALLLHPVEAVLGLGALLQELLHQFLHGEVSAPLPRSFRCSGRQITGRLAAVVWSY